jgi:hypothetical protein
MELVDAQNVSDFTKKTLAQFGWVDGDPLPVDLGPMLVKVRESLPPSPRSDVLVDIDTMPPLAVEQAKQMLAAAKQVAAQQAEEQKRKEAVAQLNPAAQRLMQFAEDVAPAIVDDRNDTPPPVSEPPPPPPPPLETPESEEAPAESNTGLGQRAMLPFCPRCGWDMRQKFEIVPTDLDKEDFLAAALGSQKFQRDYEIFGGKIRIVFHTILAEESKMLHRQLVLDQENKKIVTEAEWFVRMLEYRLALSLSAITDNRGKPTAVIPALGGLPSVEGESPLETLTNYVNNTVLAHEVTRRLVGSHLRQFQRLVEALEAMALEPSFWNGIA